PFMITPFFFRHWIKSIMAKGYQNIFGQQLAKSYLQKDTMSLQHLYPHVTLLCLILCPPLGSDLRGQWMCTINSIVFTIELKIRCRRPDLMKSAKKTDLLTEISRTGSNDELYLHICNNMLYRVRPNHAKVAHLQTWKLATPDNRKSNI